MVCLNLPLDLRHRPENVYLAGIIPGPSKPSLQQINNLLKHLVDDLEILWHQGATYTTKSYPGGRKVRCAVVPLVCDMIAAHEVAGFSSHSSKYFCPYCFLELRDINNIDMETWKQRDFSEHLVQALKWKNASSEADRNKITAEFGLRFSELLRLSYWKATAYTIIDSMHALLLGLLESHCRDILGMSNVASDFDGVRCC
ncbi:hypothetical protein SISNIDRAFT_416779 [Sistotremastrum niveocremeum HHB9708]|uniref:Transposase domain-containing protein n=1 Tax=Sistotremastrum niveocremeum HHB9708 TaxID=1314777 RepID=A0A164QJ37_9AGAM|nr:hypothetical protein SISNIDRAFT_416779 [Sistotremastrum niveocremeum HHB9708]